LLVTLLVLMLEVSLPIMLLLLLMELVLMLMLGVVHVLMHHLHLSLVLGVVVVLRVLWMLHVPPQLCSFVLHFVHAWMPALLLLLLLLLQQGSLFHRFAACRGRSRSRRSSRRSHRHLRGRFVGWHVLAGQPLLLLHAHVVRFASCLELPTLRHHGARVGSGWRSRGMGGANLIGRLRCACALHCG
jgi:hypothetical protein